MLITKSDGGHLRGILTLGGLCLPYPHCHYNDNEETFKQPSYLRYVDRRYQELGSLVGWFKTYEISPERLCLALKWITYSIHTDSTKPDVIGRKARLLRLPRRRTVAAAIIFRT